MTRALRARLTKSASRWTAAAGKPRSSSAVMPGTRGRQRCVLAAFMAVTAAGGLALVAQPALAAALCVGSGPGCYPTIQAAVNAAQDGDTITIGPGTFAGGVTITTSVSLQGAGAAATIISGGGSVLTIGAFGASSEPTVSISGVTITGGVAQSSPESIPFTGKAGVWAAGGGIEIPPGAQLGVGATVTISDSVITGNRAAPVNTIPSGIACPGSFPDGQCPFAPAWGGGIDSWGTLTLTHTAVTDNSVGTAAGLPGITSDADGAGIFSSEGSLTLANSVISGNNATATSPDGRYAEGAAIFAGYPGFGPANGSDALTIQDSVIAGNTATVTSDLPRFFGGEVLNPSANSGGVVSSTGVSSTTVENTQVESNSAIATDLNGEPSAFDAGMNVSGSLDMTNSVISGNRTIANASTSADVGPSGSALEVDGGGTISGTRITDNYASMVSTDGTAAVNGALGLFGNTSLLTVQDSTISGNVATATSTGSVSFQGAGVFNDGLLTLTDDTITGNSGTATGPSGVAQGGGIWNGTTFTGPPVQLTLQGTAVTRNSLSGSAGVTVQGAGLFTAPPATVILTDSVIALNVPDQCFGC
jgi:hypothetical protein